MSWARPRQWSEGETLSFSLNEDAQMILPPSMEGPREVILRDEEGVHDGFIAPEQWSWEQYVISEADEELEREHDRERGRNSEERRSLYIAFAALPILGERQTQEGVAQEYCEWCGLWGSPGLFGFLFASAGFREGEWFVQERRTGGISTEREFYERYPEADVGDERYREPVRVEWLSREVELMRHALTLSLVVQGQDVDAAEREAAETTLSEHLPYAAQGMSTAPPDYRQGVNLQREDEMLSRWLWAHASRAQLAFTRGSRTCSREVVWTFDSFMAALYHLLLEDITGGQLIKRCADPKCRRFFRPDRDAEYHDGRCRNRVDKERQRAKKAAERPADRQ